MKKLSQATLAGGCFWCTEAIFARLKGVSSIQPGYAGGQDQSPTYDEVSAGNTGHAEAIQFFYDPEIISYADLLRIFFHLHDPTTLNRQGPDTGTQYRSAIFFHDAQQEKTTREMIRELQPEFDQPIVTEIRPYQTFYLAEDYHHDYYRQHGDAPYCQLVIEPKIKKLLAKYRDRVKPEYKK